MKYIFIFAIVALLGMFLVYKYQEAHPEKQGLFNYDLNKGDDGERKIAKPSTYRILEAKAADRFLVLRNNTETQNFHLVGAVGIPSDGRDIFECGKSAEELKALFDEARDFVQKLVVGRSDLHVVERNREHKNGELFVEGGIILTNGASLCELLVKRGYVQNDPDAVTDYESLEKTARNKEKGIWKHAVPYSQRFKVSSSIRQRSLTKDSYSQTASMTQDILEKVASEERCVSVNLSFNIKPPIMRSYEFKIFCDFGMDEIVGISEEDDSEARRHKDTEHVNETFVVSDAATNIVIKSSAFEMSRISRGGRSFRQGMFCSSCAVRVFLEGEQIYFAEEYF
ncbi:thermonuclease family protein [bacterium]|nr:thermonuclease family protein [bacterium]